MEPGDRIGPFTLGPVLGRGGTAIVHRARHVADGTPVALKVLRPEAIQAPGFAESFAREVRAAAGLNHPRITAIYDHGQVTADEAGAQPGLAGTPWLAMELVDGQTLWKRRGELDWPALRSALLDVLEALAHAHARGLIHRDIKPGNVLVDAQTGRATLTDFGLVHSTADVAPSVAGAGEVHGTPKYMAPEQIRDETHRLGPWTDLYAVGMMAWTLACRTSPFAGDATALCRQQLHAALPPFRPTRPVPAAFLDWIEALVAIDPAHRFRRAADAAHALRELAPEPMLAVAAEVAPGVDAAASLDLETVPVPASDLDALPEFDDVLELLGGGSVAPLDPERTRQAPTALATLRAPFPDRWQVPRRDRPHLHGAGLALFGLRSTGTVGRAAERARLWSRLGEAVTQRRVQFVLVEGPAGSGKTTLAQWLAMRADELGVARWTVARHSATADSGDALAAALGHLLRVAHLPLQEAVAAATEDLGALGLDTRDDAIGLVQLARPGRASDGEAGWVAHFGTQAERLTLVARYLAAVARSRPLVLWLDELHLDDESLALVERLLASDVEAPVCVVGTVRTGDVPKGTELATRLEALVDHDRAERLTLPPLGADGLVALIRELLGLDLALAATVEERCGGNPQFAVQLVSDWVARGLLEPTPTGFDLVAGADTAIPADLLALWRQRLSRIFAGQSGGAISAVELGAMLGTQVRQAEWEDATRRAGVRPGPDLMAALEHAHFIRVDPEGGGWRFVHALCREALLDQAARAGRAVPWAEIAAGVVPSGTASVARRARLLMAAGRPDDALRPLTDAVLREARLGDFGRARHLFQVREGLLADRPIDPRGPDALATAVCRHFLQPHGVRYPAVRRDGPALIAWAEASGEWAHLGNLLLDYGTSFRAAGEYDVAMRHLQRSLAVARRHHLPTEGEVLNRMSFVSGRAGRHAAAAGYARDAIHAAEARGDTYGVGTAYLNLGDLHRLRGERALAGFYIHEARERFERVGSRRGLADVHHARGDMARADGRYEEAEQAYAESAARYRGCGSSNVAYAELNLGLTRCEAGRFAEARSLFERMLRSGGAREPGPLQLWVRLCRCSCLAHDADWVALEAELPVVAARLVADGMVEHDAARVGALCAEQCERHGHLEMARVAWEMTAGQLEGLGHGAEAREARARAAGASRA